MTAPDRIAFSSTEDPPEPWRAVLAALDPPLELRVWPGEVDDPRGIEAALVWQPAAGMWAALPDLRLIQSLGAGVDHVFRTGPPAGLPVARHVDPDLTRQMAEYGVLAVLACHRGLHAHLANQRRRVWGAPELAATERRRVGVMGAGVLGTALLGRLAPWGFPLRAWTRTPREERAGVRLFHGAGGLAPFLRETDILVSYLPATPETAGLLDAARLAELPPGAFLVSLGRGEVVREDDLAAALASDRLGGCFLDVFAEEPLDPGSPLWTDPRVIVTPHAAGVTRATAHAAELLAGNLARVRRGERPLHEVGRGRGY